METFTGKQLAQARGTNIATSVYSPATGINGTIRNIILTNTTDDTAEYTLYVDNDGITYDESTTIAWEIELRAGKMLQISCYIPMNNAEGNFAFKSSVNNGITITLFGAEVT